MQDFASKENRRQPIRVLHLRDSPWIDGPGRTILESGVHFDRERIDYHVGAFVPDSRERHPMVEGARARAIAVHEILDRGGMDWRVSEQVVRLVRDLGIDVLHTSDLRTRIFGSLCRARSPNLKLITTTHGWIANSPIRRAMRFLDKVLLRQCDAVVMVSNAMRPLVPRWWLPDSRVSVIHNALVTSCYGAGMQPRRPLLSAQDSVTLLNVGRLSKEKGQMLLLEAVARVASENPRLKLIFAGIGPLESVLKQAVTTLGLVNRVEFRGYVADMPALYAEADLVVQSSLTEGLPNVVLEAGFLEVPVLATAVGGTGEVIQHGASGWLIKPNSADEIADGIRAFLRAPQDFANMARRAREKVVAEFAFEARTARMMRLYEQVMGRAGESAQST